MVLFFIKIYNILQKNTKKYYGGDQAFWKDMGRWNFCMKIFLIFWNCVVIGQFPGGIARKRAWNSVFFYKYLQNFTVYFFYGLPDPLSWCYLSLIRVIIPLCNECYWVPFKCYTITTLLWYLTPSPTSTPLAPSMSIYRFLVHCNWCIYITRHRLIWMSLCTNSVLHSTYLYCGQILYVVI